jgi:uncharacterized DUF497 family protein
MYFEWDDSKNDENLMKHGLSFYDAQKAFLDSKRIIMRDVVHSQHEERFFCIGDTGLGIATVRFTVRGEAIRIFGAGYWRKGKRAYDAER